MLTATSSAASTASISPMSSGVTTCRSFESSESCVPLLVFMSSGVTTCSSSCVSCASTEDWVFIDPSVSWESNSGIAGLLP
ncbi:hypothetical protein PI125_g9336 [Phytophthora idaei]|nr:hypothetical protein PI125_g9336 [Phytophthora idaei]KAG3156768.1 hypothetical protein PI126_g8640 [Phytophthora idaei]